MFFELYGITISVVIFYSYLTWEEGFEQQEEPTEVELVSLNSEKFKRLDSYDLLEAQYYCFNGEYESKAFLTEKNTLRIHKDYILR